MPTGIIAYVVAALAFLALLAGAHEVGFRRAAAVGDAKLAAYQAQAQAETEKLREKSAQVETRVVVEYRDRVKVIREQGPEVVREIEVIRNSGCTLPGEFRGLHDSAAVGDGAQAAAGANDPAPVPCDVAVTTIRENYRIARENAEQLRALQEWTASVSTP